MLIFEVVNVVEVNFLLGVFFVSTNTWHNNLAKLASEAIESVALTKVFILDDFFNLLCRKTLVLVLFHLVNNFLYS